MTEVVFKLQQSAFSFKSVVELGVGSEDGKKPGKILKINVPL